MASVLCVQQKMSRMRSIARSRQSYRLWCLENRGWMVYRRSDKGYKEVRLMKGNAMSITAIEAR